MVYRVPETGAAISASGRRSIVRESQTAVFYRDGKALDTFGPGRHTITTANIPLLADLVGLLTRGQTPFTAEVYFVNMRDFIDMKWGTPEPIALRDKDLGLARLRAFGSYSMADQRPADVRDQDRRARRACIRPTRSRITCAASSSAA